MTSTDGVMAGAEGPSTSDEALRQVSGHSSPHNIIAIAVAVLWVRSYQRAVTTDFKSPLGVHAFLAFHGWLLVGFQPPDPEADLPPNYPREGDDHPQFR